MHVKEIGIVSSLIIAGGVFAPLIKIPFGSVNYFSSSDTTVEAIIFLALSGIGIFLFWRESYKKAKILGVIVGIISIVNFFLTLQNVNKMKAKALGELAGNPFAEIATGIINNGVGLSWGWAIFVIGTIGIMYAGSQGVKKYEK